MSSTPHRDQGFTVGTTVSERWFGLLDRRERTEQLSAKLEFEDPLVPTHLSQPRPRHGPPVVKQSQHRGVSVVKTEVTRWSATRAYSERTKTPVTTPSSTHLFDGNREVWMRDHPVEPEPRYQGTTSRSVYGVHSRRPRGRGPEPTVRLSQDGRTMIRENTNDTVNVNSFNIVKISVWSNGSHRMFSGWGIIESGAVQSIIQVS